MSKIIVKVFLPQIRKSYDVRISTDALVGQINGQMTALFSKMWDVAFIPDEKTALCDAGTGKILDENLLIAETGIGNGSRLLLI